MSNHRKKTDTSSGIDVSTESDDTMNEDTPVSVASAVKEGETPSVVDMTVEIKKLSSLEDTTVLRSFRPLSTPVTTMAGNAPSKSSYANVTSKPSGKKLNIHTLFTPGGNEIDVVVPVESIRAISMIELRADVELKDNIFLAMPKITRVCHYIRNFRVEYEWKPPRCASCMVFGHIHKECPKNTGAGFKPQKEYRPVLKKPTASSSGNKKKAVEHTIEVSNLNLFEVLSLVDNDVEL
ncbi:hypothetical protein Tco_0841670, partial [Tanacetum coccineum]